MDNGPYQILKCNLHTHFEESYGNSGARIMVDAYQKAGYDCIALTEHCGFMTTLDVAKEAREYAADRYGDSFVVVVGEELNFKVNDSGILCAMDLVGLFLDEFIGCGWTGGEDVGTAKFPTAEEALSAIHSQGGIGIVAHDALTAIGWHAADFGMENPLWTWDIRKGLPFDGWEVGNAAGYDSRTAEGRDLMLSHPQESVDEGYIVTASSDAHSVDHVESHSFCRTYLFVTERTTEGIKKALMDRRTVADCKGQLFGRPEWVGLLKKQRQQT